MSISKPQEQTLTHSPQETMAWGKAFAQKLNPGDVVALTGDLGAGKTCLVKGIAEGLGVTATVTSPTFTLIHEYAGLVPLVHADLYRLETAEEALRIGVTEYFGGDGVCVVEWAERIAALLPSNTWRVEIEVVNETTREIVVRRG